MLLSFLLLSRAGKSSGGVGEGGTKVGREKGIGRLGLGRGRFSGSSDPQILTPFLYPIPLHGSMWTCTSYLVQVQVDKGEQMQ